MSVFEKLSVINVNDKKSKKNKKESKTKNEEHSPDFKYTADLKISDIKKQKSISLRSLRI